MMIQSKSSNIQVKIDIQSKLDTPSRSFEKPEFEHSISDDAVLLESSPSKSTDTTTIINIIDDLLSDTQSKHLNDSSLIPSKANLSGERLSEVSSCHNIRNLSFELDHLTFEELVVAPEKAQDMLEEWKDQSKKSKSLDFELPQELVTSMSKRPSSLDEVTEGVVLSQKGSEDTIDSFTKEYYSRLLKERPSKSWLGSVLRDWKFNDKADQIDELSLELKHAVKDIQLSMVQVKNAFVIEEENIDHMSGHIENTTKDLKKISIAELKRKRLQVLNAVVIEEEDIDIVSGHIGNTT